MNRDREFLLRALELAARRRGFTAPNPAVGSVIVKNGEVLGEGFHHGAGLPHAEVEAIKSAKKEVRSATVYVTLEPCCHFGKTPPCTDLLKEKQVERVVFGLTDPNPKVAGKGMEQLVQAGIQVEHLFMREIEEFYQPYSWWTKTGNTWLTGKLALSKDGKVALSDGTPVKITGDLANAYTHSRRAKADVLVTSINTLISDNPRLDVRQESFITKKPVWVLDRGLKFSLDYKLMTTAQSVTLIHGRSVDLKKRKFFEQAGIRCIEISELSRELGRNGYHEAWCETGPTLFSQFAREKHFQEMVIYRSNVLEIGDGKEAFPKGTEPVFEKYRKESEEVLGSDVKERWFLK